MRQGRPVRLLGGIKQRRAVWRGPQPHTDGKAWSLAVSGVSRGESPLGKISPVKGGGRRRNICHILYGTSNEG